MAKQKTRNKNNNEKERGSSQVQVINRAARILRTLRDSGGLNLSNLANEVGLARSTVHRIVSTLEAENFVSTSSPDGRIQLGIGLISLGVAVKSDLRRELRPYLENLSIEVNETVDLAILKDKKELLFLDQISRPRRLRAVSGIGIKFPLHCTANGKAILSSLPVETIKILLPEELKVYTPKTIKTRTELLQELEEIRTTGLAFDCEEHTLGICAVGAVIKVPIEYPTAISIPVPSIRFFGQEEILASAIRQTALEIESRFNLIEV